jgi:hypothetical protein
MDKGTLLVVVPQPTCPVTLSSAVHAASDYLKSATLRNNSDSVLTGFRIGWMVEIPARKAQIHFGKHVNFREGIKPNGSCAVPAQAVSVHKHRTLAAVIAFFVAEVFLLGQAPWTADLREIEDEVTQITGN